MLTSTQRRIPTAPHDVSHFERVSSPALTLRAFTRKSRANQRGATCLRQLLLGQRDGGHSLQGGKGSALLMTILDFLLDRSTPIRELSRVTQAKSFVFMFVEFELPRGLFFTLSTYNSTS